MANHSVGYLTKHLSKYFTQHNILTNCISPGLIDTKFHTNVMKRTPEEIVRRSQTVRLRKAGTPKDVASLIYYLGFENEFITGQNIKIEVVAILSKAAKWVIVTTCLKITGKCLLF